MITKDQARNRVLEEIKKRSDVELGILDDLTLEFEYGWMFFYQSMKYIETGDLNELVGGNAPIICDKTDCRMYVTGTGKNKEHYLEKFKEFKSNFKLINS